MNVCKLGLSIAMLLSGGMAFAQGTVDDYNPCLRIEREIQCQQSFLLQRHAAVDRRHTSVLVCTQYARRPYLRIGERRQEKQKGVVRPQASGKRTEQRIRHRSKARGHPTGTATREAELRQA